MAHRTLVLGAFLLLAVAGCAGGDAFGSLSEAPASSDSGVDAEGALDAAPDAEPASDAGLDAPGDDGTAADGGEAGDSSAAPDSAQDAAPELDSNPDSPSTQDAAGDVASDGQADAAEGAVDDASPEAAPQDASDAGQQDGAPVEACVAVTYYRDKDDDGYGDSADHIETCSASAGWVDVAGDCRDDDPRVHPGQQDYFGEGYPDPNRPAGISFDFDCDGAEEGDPADEQAPSCGGLLICQGVGYEKYSPARSGPAIDPYCGSNRYTTCTSSGLTCKANTVTSADSYACR